MALISTTKNVFARKHIKNRIQSDDLEGKHKTLTKSCDLLDKIKYAANTTAIP